MTARDQVELDADLVAALRQVAQQRGLSADELLYDLVRQFLRKARREKIRQEFAAYQAMHSQLAATRLGEHVAIHEGQVVDHDQEPDALLRRVRERFGRTPVLIVQVREQPAREFVIRSPRLSRAE